ncbi:MAG: hypothetical protein AB1490_16640 [Pseudomonadota bacterium]
MWRPALLALLLVTPALAAEDIFANRPAFSAGDQPAQRFAACEEIRSMSAGLPPLEERVDLSLTGTLNAVRTDGALWYLTMCADVRVLCVTYESNDMKPGDRVTLKGGYVRRDDNHVMLDPCLANRAK